MRFELRLERDGFSIEAAMEKGRELPDWFLEAPPEPEWPDSFWLRAFLELSTGRSTPNSALSWRDILLFAQFSGLEQELWEPFTVLMRALDEEHMKWVASERKRQVEAATPPPPKRK